MRIRDRIGRVALDVEAYELLLTPASSVPIDPTGIHPLGPWISQKLVESRLHRSESLAVDRLVDTVVPFDPSKQRHARNVRATDVGRVASGSLVRRVEEVGFGVEGHARCAFDDIEFEVWA